MTTRASAAGVYALLIDGSTAEIRAVAHDDLDAVRSMHEAMSPKNLYLRFFGLDKRAAEQEAQRLCRQAGPDHAALLARLRGEVVGVASYEPTVDPGVAEIAFAVADGWHHRGVATLLLEHLVSVAGMRHLRAFTAETLTENSPMLRVFADAGLGLRRRTTAGVVELTIPIPRPAAIGQPSPYLEAVAEREQRADVASLAPLLTPGSVAVVGASRDHGSLSRVILRNIRGAGFGGDVYAVNPHADQIGDVPCVPSVAALPEPVDLAVLAVPPAAVPRVAQECGERGIRALVVITSGLDIAQEDDTLTACRRHGMRLVGPDCLGVAVPGIGLDATFAARHPAAGRAGVAVQSGGVGVALLEHLSRLGVGVSSFASVGGKLDVSAGDLLCWWEQDGLTRLAVLDVESFGNPRKFARTARRVGRKLPVLTVHTGRSVPGQRAAASHTASAAAPLITRQALFEQAGIIATTSLGELLDAAALLATQPVPAGGRVAIISNAGGAGLLAADACADAGLAVHTLSSQAQRALRQILPPGALVTGPVDTTAPVSAGIFRRSLEAAAADDVDAVLAVVMPSAVADLFPALSAAGLPVPVAAVVLGQPESVRLLPADQDGSAAVPTYAYPESAARALGRAARYGGWLARPAGMVPAPGGIREADAQALVRSFLRRLPGGGWLPQSEVAELLRCYRVPIALRRVAGSADAAAAAAAELGGRVAITADIPGLLPAADGAVQLDVGGAVDARRAYEELAAQFGGRLTGVLVQPMVTDGAEVAIGVLQEPVFGPVVLFGPGGGAAGPPSDHSARLAPLTDADADDLIQSVGAAALLQGRRGVSAAGLTALTGILMRVSRLADDLSEVAELDLNPVIVRADGVVAVDGRIRLTHRVPVDPFLRRLR